jgi:hypothetical protein
MWPMKACRPWRLLGAIQAIGLLAASLPGWAQTGGDNLHPGLDAVPFEAWAAAGEQQQIRWGVRISRPALRYDQRQQVVIDVAVPLRTLRQQSAQRELYLLVKVADAQGNWLPGASYRKITLDGSQRLGARSLTARVPVLLQPGAYDLGILLYERQLGQHNFTRRRVQVPELRNDPLPQLAVGLPPMEFLPPPDAVRRPVRAPLPLESERPLHLEVVAHIGLSPQYAGSPQAHRANLENVLQVLHVLTRLRPRDGAVSLTVVDVAGMRQVFSHPDARRLDWQELADAMGQFNPMIVDARSLERRGQMAIHFRDQMAQLLSRPLPQPPSHHPGGDAAPRRPLRVLVVVGSPMVLPPRTPVPQLELAASCGCRVYLLQPKLQRSNLWDDLGKVFRPLRPRTFKFDQPRQFRQALAAMMKELQEAQ